MLKEALRSMMKGYVLVQYRWVFFAKLIASFFIVMIFIILVEIVTGPGQPVNAQYSASGVYSPADMRGTFKPVLLRWMRDRSDMPEEVLSSIYDAAVKSSNPDMVLAICLVESNFNPGAKSSRGAIGLMGIMPDVWLDELKAKGILREKRDLYAISSNIASGAYVFGRYLSTTNSIEKALFLYVGGDTGYSGKVLQALREIYLTRSFGEQGPPDLRAQSVSPVLAGFSGQLPK